MELIPPGEAEVNCRLFHGSKFAFRRVSGALITLAVTCERS